MSNLIYQYEKKSGFNGTGAWVVYDEPDCYGHRSRVGIFGSEQECIDFCEAERCDTREWCGDEWEEERMQMGYM